MAPVLGGSALEGLPVPAPGQFLDRRHVDDPVVEVVDDLGHVGLEEGLVGPHGVPGEQGLTLLGDVAADVGHDLLSRFGHGQALGEIVEQPGGGVHVAHEVVHVIERRLRGCDEHIDPFVHDVEIRIRDDDRHLDQRVLTDVESGHFAVDPYERILELGSHCFSLRRAH